MKISLVIPIHREADRIAASAQDLNSFFARWPMQVELIFVIEPGEDPATLRILNEAVSNSSEHIQIRILQNKKHLGRGPSVKRGLDEALGDVLGVLSADLTTPLADVFSALQEFITKPDETSFIIGNRRSLKRPRHGPRSALKRFFDDVEHEKAKGLDLPDPTSPFWLIRRDLWQKISPNLKFRRWYYTPALLQKIRSQGAPIKSIEILSHDTDDTRFHWWHSILS